MGLKTFNLDEEAYQKFSKFCRDHGISMSKQVEIFIRAQIEEEPEVKREYLDRLERMRKGRFIRVENFTERYGA